MKPRIMITVETYDLTNKSPEVDDDGNEKPVAIREIDHNDKLHREWFEKHLWWALRNGREVRALPSDAA